MNFIMIAIGIICMGIIFIFFPMHLAQIFVRLGIARQGEEKRWAIILFVTIAVTFCMIAVYCGIDLRSLIIMISVCIILGALFFLFLPRICTEKVQPKHHPDYDKIAEKIKEFQFVNREEFEIWRNRTSLPKSILLTYEDYIKIVNQTPEEKEMSNVIHQVLKEFFKGKKGFFGN